MTTRALQYSPFVLTGKFLSSVNEKLRFVRLLAASSGASILAGFSGEYKI